ncbi:unnamed protein product [Parajaminaea phylloscopi]
MRPGQYEMTHKKNAGAKMQDQASSEPHPPVSPFKDEDGIVQARKRPRQDETGIGKERADRSCAECRRLKLKCSRQWPCTNCVKRNCSALCPTSTLKKEPVDQTALLQHASLLFRYVTDLEATLHAHGLRLPLRSADTPVNLAHLMELCASPSQPAGQQPQQPQSQYPQPVFPDLSGTAGYSGAPHNGAPHNGAPHNVPALAAPQLALESDPPDPKRAPPHGSKEESAMADYGIGQWSHNDPESEEAAQGEPSRGPESSFGPRQVSQKRVRIDEAVRSRPSPARSGLGTLVISENGTSKYMGPSAGSEWLHGLEAHEAANGTDAHKAASSDEWAHRKMYSGSLSSIMGAQMSLMSSSQRRQLLDSLAVHLPPKREALATMEWYFRHSTWMFHIVRKSKLHSIVDLTYSRMSTVPHDRLSSEAAPSRANGSASSSARHRQKARQMKADELALIFSMLALGAWFDTTLSMAESAQSSTKWFHASQMALSASNCVTSPSSVGVQVFHLTALYLLHSQQMKGGDLVWPLLGLCLRMTQAMGLHVDGEAWDLDHEQLNDRRRQFWEIYCHDTFTAICFGRPGNLYAHEYNCKFPVEEEAQPPSYGDDVDDATDASAASDGTPSVGYYTLKFRLARIARRMLSEVFGVRTPRYRDVLAFEAELRRFDEQLPYHMRSLVSDGAQFFRASVSQQAPRPSPEVRSERLRLTIHQHDLASCIVQLRWSLHRRPFAEAILMDPENPLRTPYAASFVAALESAAQLIAISNSLFQLYPKISMRHSSFWYHSFSASVLCAFCCFHAPRSELALAAFTQLNTMCNLLERARETPRMEQGLRQLLRLRERAIESLNNAHGVQPSLGGGMAQGSSRRANGQDPAHTSADHEAAQAMMGISTRLLRRDEGPVTRANSEEPEGRPATGDGKGSAAKGQEPNQSERDALQAILLQGQHLATTPSTAARANGDQDVAGGMPSAYGTASMPPILPLFDPTEMSQEDLDALLPMNHTELMHSSTAGRDGTSRPELQADLEQLLSMEDIWLSLGGGGSATADTGGTETSSTRGGGNFGTPDGAASAADSDLLSSCGAAASGPGAFDFELPGFGIAGTTGMASTAPTNYNA